ncbi:hypothetical protein VSS37_21450 [Candidatus Thiothrix sp. Deng01]|uniref:ScoMcrA-like DNA sulfur-binding domain-containing protein n=1 Tax=Candidatus Thiothrix phosphatis TaxID=3112415 RepID=A0ABU6D4G6_9GAMM|nr:hypothetical protein [Candidatus Thiothrix sp. Deng01]MEB4593558.1 hypothetical protein [Candidatus Thiothrix sp. Deng01]
MKSIFDQFSNISVYKENGEYFLHKPLLLLSYLGFCWNNRERLISYNEADKELTTLFDAFYPAGSEYNNTHYPFGKLENDGIWEVEGSSTLKRTSVGHLIKSELINFSIRAGFTKEIYDTLSENKYLLLDIVSLLLGRYFPPEKHQGLRAAVGLPDAGHTRAHDILYGVKQDMGTIEELPMPAEAKQDNRVNDGNLNLLDMIATFRSKNKDQQNAYISYLNSLHNLSADGSNALAESQALNPYFDELYVAFPLVETVKEALTSGEEKVIVLTGHAGDGKSTVALDVFKHLNGYVPKQPLQHKLKELEEVRSGDRKISIVKDMSELGAKERVSWLDSAFDKPGSWLIISNTGPLLDSLSGYVREYHNGADSGWIENEVLKKLDTPYQKTNLPTHTLQLPEVSKPLVILNMTRLNNVDLGAQVLEKMLSHSGWSKCQGCDVEDSCPLRKNRQALRQQDITDRVRWVYQRLTAYEQRLTLRQIVAHLAYSVTGGLDCTQARTSAYDTQASNGEVNVGLENILFSESFFGYKNGEVNKKAGTLKAIELIHRLEFGSPFAVDFERKLIANDDTSWIDLPPALTPVAKRWRNYSREATGIRWRFALRRMAYLYGRPVSQHEQTGFESFLDNFLQAPKLRQFDRWQRKGELDLSSSEQRAFKNNILDVLLEVYSGFNAGQFKDSNNRLYLTLRRPDKAVVQPAQMVIASFNTNDFSVGYDIHQQLPFLRYRDAKLMLSLPLLDYIQTCSIGSIGNQLVPIHLAQLEWFRSKLLKISEHETTNNDEFIVLSAEVDGTVKTSHFYIDKSKNTLEFV